MTIFGNLCAGLLGLSAIVMFRFVSDPVSRYDYIAAILFSILLLAMLFGLFFALVWTGKLDFLGWPRFIQYGGVAIASLSLTVLIGASAAMHGSGGREFPWSIRPFCPWAAYLFPLAMALLGGFWLNSARVSLPESYFRVAFGIATGSTLLSNLVFVVEIQNRIQQKAEERADTNLRIVQQTDAEQDFSRVLIYTAKSENPNVRQLAVQKVLATGPRFNTLMIECLKAPVFQEGLTYLRDNEPPGDAAPLAVPARDAILKSAERMRDDVATGRPLERKDVESGVDSVLVVAEKFSKYGTEFLPAVRDYRAALEAPKSAKVPSACLKKMDEWLAAKSK